MQYKAVIFDVGGTLLRWGDWPVFERFLRKHSECAQDSPSAQLRTDASLLRELMISHFNRNRAGAVGQGANEDEVWSYWQRVLAVALREWNRPDYGDHLLEPMASAVVLGQMDELFTDTRSTLDRLRSSGVTLGVISNWNRNLPHELARLGLDVHFEFVIVSSIAGVAKPAPEIFNMGLRAAGCESHEALYVGDNVDDDCLGAHGVGMDVVLIDRTGRLQHRPSSCTRVYSSLEELTDDLLRTT